MTFTQELTERNNTLSKRKTYNRAKERFDIYAEDKGIKGRSRLFVLEHVEKELNIDAPRTGKAGSTIRARLISAMKKLRGGKAGTYGKKPSEVENTKVKRFYVSWQWRAVRYDILEANNGKCECCGRGKHDGATLNVDHIKPLRKYWKLRLDKNNLQILCELCNHGKGNRYETDWREPSLKALMGEEMS